MDESEEPESDVGYEEISDDVEENDTIAKKEISLKPINELEPEIVHPEKGRDIEVNLNESDDDEDIEIL